MYVFDDSILQLIQQSNDIVVLEEDKGLDGVTPIPPLLGMNPRVVELFANLDERKC